MTLRHKKRGFEIKIESKRGKPLVQHDDTVKVISGNYKHMDTLHIDVIEEKFEVVR